MRLSVVRRPEAWSLYGEAERADPLGCYLAVLALGVNRALEVIGRDLPHHGVDEVLDLAREQRLALLAGKVEDMINTVVRQIAFYSFERAVHTERKNGELTAERIGQLWLSVQGESLGPAIEIKPGYETFWMYMPHFIHSPFYVYAYAFGDCLVNSLYAVYEHASEGFAERYLDMLAAGGTKHYSELLRPFGLDAKDPKFWDGGLSVIAVMFDELEAMG
ncbi:M3 family metallopeptidase [Sphingomonas endophytica]|uniref:M3 family metallopeptidase n=1 Tax=Sphingomonas endophytica TaxID=869719 RepID=UPI0019D40BFD|nr:M3 family metallopeptidase [Sphingomonas endophytica]